MIQRFCKGYLDRKDVQAQRDADQTEHEAYSNSTIEGISKKLGLYSEKDPTISSLLERGPTRFQRPKKIIRMHGGHEIGIYDGEWAINDFSNASLFRREMRHGFGIFTAYPSGSYYEGQWVSDMKNGMGRMIEPDGTVYDGAWKDNQQNGQGKMILTNGTFFEGTFVNGKKHGPGKFFWDDTSTFVGNFIMDKMEGHGVYKWADGTGYDGEWSGNLMHG